MISVFEKSIEELSNDLISSTQELIRIPSVHSESSNPSKPFGENIANALDYILNLGKKLGFKTKNVDGYCRIHRIW